MAEGDGEGNRGAPTGFAGLDSMVSDLASDLDNVTTQHSATEDTSGTADQLVVEGKFVPRLLIGVVFDLLPGSFHAAPVHFALLVVVRYTLAGIMRFRCCALTPLDRVA